MANNAQLRAGKIRLRMSAGLAALLGLSLATQAAAQTESQSADDRAAESGDIIVTAQKRAQSLQDVPISVSVLSGDKIADSNYRSLQDLSRDQPALSIFPSGRAVRISLRGVASGTNPALDQSVPTFIDDVYHGKSRASGSTLLDVERIEILKGPQATFFGNNAIGGAISVKTRRPGRELEGSLRALYGTHGEYAAEAIINIPASEQLAVRAAILANGMNGYLLDRTGGGKLPRERNVAARFSALWTPNDSFELFLKAEATVNRNQGGGLLQMVRCPPLAPFTAPGMFCPQAIAANADTVLNDIRDSSPGQYLDLRTQDLQAIAAQRLGALTLTSVSALSYMQFDNTQDNDLTPSLLFHLSQPQRYRQFSQELRLTSDDTGPLSFTIGGYFQSSRYDDTFEVAYAFLSGAINNGAPFAALRPFLPFGVAIKYRLDEKVYSGFGSLTWKVTDQLSVTAGARASRVTKSFNQQRYFGQATGAYGQIVPFDASLQPTAQLFASSVPPPPYGLGVAGTTQLARSDGKVTPTFNLQYKANRDLNFYASYTEGFKSGGFNGVIASGVAAQYPFAPEQVRAYEVGMRSQWLDRRLLFNISAFRSQYKNLQVSINQVAGGAVIGLIQNAASEISQGVELESRFAVTPSFSVGTSLSFLDAHYGSYTIAPSTSEQRLATGTRTQDLSGKDRIFAPHFAGTFFAAFEHPINDRFKITLQADLLHQSSYFLADGNDPFLVQRPYEKLDLRAAIGTIDDSWEAAVIAKNVTNATILTGGLDFNSAGTYILSKERPRSIVVQMRTKF